MFTYKFTIISLNVKLGQTGLYSKATDIFKVEKLCRIRKNGVQNLQVTHAEFSIFYTQNPDSCGNKSVSAETFGNYRDCLKPDMLVWLPAVIYCTTWSRNTFLYVLRTVEWNRLIRL